MRDSLLTILKKQQGEYVSGEELSKLLSVSRTAVWKHIRGLREEGYGIESSPRLGYRLQTVPDLLLPAEIRDGLETKVLGRRIYHARETGSTNRGAREMAAAGEPEGSVVLAETQSAGRGRLGRGWSSPAGGIWLSLILRPQLPPFQAQLLTMAAAVAAVEATLAAGVLPGIKWPNDLLLNGRKLAGILTEVSAEMDRVNYLVVGIGVNANIRREEMPEELRQSATSLLAETGKPADRTAWVKRFLTKLEAYYLEAVSEGFVEVLALWRHYSVTLGRDVTVRLADRTVQGTALNIDGNGALQVRTEAGVESFMAGEVTLAPVLTEGEH